MEMIGASLLSPSVEVKDPLPRSPVVLASGAMESQIACRDLVLLPSEHGRGGFAAAPPLACPESAKFHVESHSIVDTIGVGACIAIVAVVGVWFVAFVLSRMASQANSYNECWLLFALMAPTSLFGCVRSWIP